MRSKPETAPSNAVLHKQPHRYLQYSQDVTYNAKELKTQLIGTHYWNYIYYNGPSSVFTGYSWSLDVYMDYAWGQITALHSLVLLLMLLEVSNQTLDMCGLGYWRVVLTPCIVHLQLTLRLDLAISCRIMQCIMIDDQVEEHVICSSW